MDIASPWDHRVYKKEGEKTDKYQDLKRKIGKLWDIKKQEVVPVVVGALGAITKRLHTWLDKLGITIGTGLLQKTAFLGIARILTKVLERWKRSRRNDSRDLWPLHMACNLGVVTSV